MTTVLKTGLTPSASGSAYLELEPPRQEANRQASFQNALSGLKLACSIHGPRPLPRSTLFTPHVLLSTHIKFAPFASQRRRGYIRDSSERDLAMHLENALRGVVIGDRWPKSGIDIVITIIEGEEDCPDAVPHSKSENRPVNMNGWGLMSVLSGCITVASAALTDAGIDCVDLASGGVAAIVRQPFRLHDISRSNTQREANLQIILDPCPSEHSDIVALCVVGYLQSRDEITEIWTQGNVACQSMEKLSKQLSLENLIDRATEAASVARRVAIEAIKETVTI